jgi:tRNA A-37 threonylcarbamoyl transferase component Bud32
VSEFVHERSGARRIARRADLTEARLRSALAAAESGAGAVVEKVGKGTLVVRVPFDTTGDAILKVRTAHGLRGRIEDAVKGSRARRAFDAAQKLAKVGVSVAEPLACVEERERDVLVLRYVAGKNLFQALTAAKPAEVAQLLARAARTAARLHAAGATHGDLKPHNVVVPSDPTKQDLVLIDLERVRFDAKKDERRVVRDLAALDAYGQRLRARLGTRARKRAFDQYVAARAEAKAPISEGRVSELLGEVIVESRKKRERWRKAGIG